jgi:hypothetical protein
MSLHTRIAAGDISPVVAMALGVLTSGSAGWQNDEVVHVIAPIYTIVLNESRPFDIFIILSISVENCK